MADDDRTAGRATSLEYAIVESHLGIHSSLFPLEGEGEEEIKARRPHCWRLPSGGRCATRIAIELQYERAQRLDGLLAIPGAAVLGAQGAHDLDELLEALGCFS